MSEGGSNSVVESQPSKLLVAGSIPVSRSITCSISELDRAGVAQLVEHLICNQRVGGSNPSASSISPRSKSVRGLRVSSRGRGDYAEMGLRPAKVLITLHRGPVKLPKPDGRPQSLKGAR